jgi:very-short-patch-repair endonuclease
VPPETRLTGDLVAAPPLDEVLAGIAARRHGLVTIAELRAAGLDDRAVSKRVARGVLHRRHRGVYSVGHAALSREGEWLAAVLACGPGAVLARWSAAELHVLTRKLASLIAVVSPRRRTLQGVRVHTTRGLDPRDITTERGIPVTTIHRLFVDLSDELTPHELVALMREARFRGRFVEPAIRDAMARASGRHNLDVLEEALALFRAGSAGTRSANEVLFLTLDLPDALVNTQLHGFEADFHWPELKLNVEIDGPQHDPVADAIRDRALNAVGYTVLRFTQEQMRERPDAVLRAVSAWVSSRGIPRAA